MDFDAFLAAIEQPSAYLTAKRETLDRATLAGLDAQMRTHRANPGKRADQHRYPLLYLFDFGDQWLFDIDIVEIADRPHRGAPDEIDAAGESPRQYPDYVYEDWEDEDSE